MSFFCKNIRLIPQIPHFFNRINIQSLNTNGCEGKGFAVFYNNIAPSGLKIINN